jgi:serine protease Do
MNRGMAQRLSAVVCLTLIGFGSRAPAGPDAHAAGSAPVAASNPSVTSTSPTPKTPPTELNLERVRQGVVELRLQSKTVALGMILDGDGRIVTALSAIGRGIGLSARYADGTTAPLRVIHTDRGWDLALVSPEDQRFTKGLLASRRDPIKEAVPLRLLRLDPARRLRPLVLGTPHRENLTGGDAALLSQAMTFTPTLSASDVGAPIVDDNGDVVAIVAQACLPTTLDRCVSIAYGAPTAEVKRFIRDGASVANSPLPWLGITVAGESSSMVPAARIVSIGPNSPASALGLRAGKLGDILLAVDGTPVGSPKDFAEVLHRHRTFDRVTLLLLAEGRYREVRVTLGRYPVAAKSRYSGQNQPDLGY